MRKFNLVNANGTRYELTEKKSFFYNANGLGFEQSNTYQRVGNRFKILQSNFKQPVIKGYVYFDSGDQAEYERFVNFCQLTPLRLEYEPIPGSVYNMQGTVTVAGYGETNHRTVDVTFTGTTLFYKTVAVTTYPCDVGEYGKIYDYAYPYQYNSATANTVTLNLDVDVESPCRLTIYGPITNPGWRHYVNNVLHATGSVEAEIEAGNRLVVDTTGDALTMLKYNANNEVIADLYQYSDFGTERAIYLRRGKNTITVENTEGSRVIVIAEGELSYASV